ncbi:MAG: class I SAM-dependent methyltransferase [Pseudomonadota bacterium]|nr:class I SAM-dependent methyltransferase [Pseudomonadota bacterium]
MTRLATLVHEGNEHQNLIAPSTGGTIWARHLVDSAQLLLLADEEKNGIWLDIGSGAGFPGLVIAALSGYEVHLVEPRRRRAEFLAGAARQLEIADRTLVHAAKVENVQVIADIISARAVATVDALLTAGTHCATRVTKWLLPKGKTGVEEIAIAKRSWHGVFHVERSVTDPDSAIVVVSGVSRR